MKIDVHAHLLDKDYLEALVTQMGLSVSRNGETGQTFLRKGKTTVAWFRDAFLDPAERVRTMDHLGIDMRILSLSSPSVYDWPAEEQVIWARRINDANARMRDLHPQRFRGLAVLPMGDVKAALDEMNRAIDGLGLVGIAMGSNIGGAPLNHPDFEALWAEIDRRRLPVVEHPMPPLGADHMDEFELPIRVGFIYETTTALTRMIYAGIFERYPNFPFVIAHTGGSLLTLLERLDNGYRIFPDCRKHITRLPSEFARQLYYDTCSFYGPAIMSAREIVGPERLLWGADDPFIGADMSHVTSLAIPEQEKDLILGGNAARLFNLG